MFTILFIVDVIVFIWAMIPEKGVDWAGEKVFNGAKMAFGILSFMGLIPFAVLCWGELTGQISFLPFVN